MTEKEKYVEEFKELCLGILAQSNNCKQSQQDFRAAKSVPEAVTAWMKYFAGVVDEVPRQVAETFGRLYGKYKSDINKAGVYYNETPPEMSNSMVVIVGDCDEKLQIGARHRVYVLGKAEVVVYWQASATVNHPDAMVRATNSARVSMREGSAEMCGSSHFVGKGTVYAWNSCRVDISGGKVYDFGHVRISAYGDSVVYSNHPQGVEVNDTACIRPFSDYKSASTADNVKSQDDI